jgi:hypothetical protein
VLRRPHGNPKRLIRRPRSERAAQHGQVVCLGAARGEHHLAGLRAQRLRNAAPRVVQRGARGPPGAVHRAGVAERLVAQEGLHGGAHFGAHRRSGRVIQIDELHEE